MVVGADASRLTTAADGTTDPPSLQTQTDTRTVNGRVSMEGYTASTRTLTSTTPAGRQTVTVLDAAGRVVEVQPPGVVPTTFTYDAQGRLATITQGTRVWTMSYDALGNLRAVRRPTGNDIEYVIDGEDRQVGKKVNGVLIQGFLYRDQLKPVAEIDGAGNVVAKLLALG